MNSEDDFGDDDYYIDDDWSDSNNNNNNTNKNSGDVHSYKFLHSPSNRIIRIFFQSLIKSGVYIGVKRRSTFQKEREGDLSLLE